VQNSRPVPAEFVCEGNAHAVLDGRKNSPILRRPWPPPPNPVRTGEHRLATIKPLERRILLLSNQPKRSDNILSRPVAQPGVWAGFPGQ
jgi:hypothetical protein